MGQFKQGLDYFPFTIGLLKDRKLRRPKLKFGCVVNDIYLSLLELIYGDKGYYLLYSKETKDDIIWEILENLQGKYCPTAETVEQVIEELVACGLFSGDHFNAEILTSKRIQQTYYSATVERKAADIDFGIWILTESEMRKLSSNSLILKNFLNRSNDEDNRSNDEDNRSNERESKEKKSKVKKNIEVSKKESNKKENLQSYDEIFETFDVQGRYKEALIEFIKYLKTSYGIVMLNDRLKSLLVALDIKYGNDELSKRKEVRRAIVNGYRRLECEEVC